MDILLHIESSTDICEVSLSRDGRHILYIASDTPRSHISELSVLIDRLLRETHTTYSELSAIAVSSGPGSYTGLRVGYATAKGLCWALDIPLIAVPTLVALAHASRALVQDPSAYFMPMIDARRQEVYTAIYDADMKTIMELQAFIIDEKSLLDLPTLDHPIYVSGDGAAKALQVETSMLKPTDLLCSARYLEAPAYSQFLFQEFEEVAYAVPLYLKPPNITQSTKKLF